MKIEDPNNLTPTIAAGILAFILAMGGLGIAASCQDHAERATTTRGD